MPILSSILARRTHGESEQNYSLHGVTRTHTHTLSLRRKSVTVLNPAMLDIVGEVPFSPAFTDSKAFH